jgi:hypothetical protein
MRPSHTCVDRAIDTIEDYLGRLCLAVLHSNCDSIPSEAVDCRILKMSLINGFLLDIRAEAIGSKRLRGNRFPCELRRRRSHFVGL